MNNSDFAPPGSCSPKARVSARTATGHIFPRILAAIRSLGTVPAIGRLVAAIYAAARSALLGLRTVTDHVRIEWDVKRLCRSIGESRPLALASLRAAIKRVRVSSVVVRLGHRVIALSTMSVGLKMTLSASYAALFALATMMVCHPVLETPDRFRFAVGLYIPLHVAIAAIPVMILIASFAMSAAIFANRTAR